MKRDLDLDKLDLKIISTLIENSRLSSREIARRLNVSVGTIQARIKRLEDLGVIRRYTVDIDIENLGYIYPVLIDIKVKGGMLREVEEIVSREPNITSVYDITGEYDITVIGWFRTRHELDDFVKKLQRIEYVERTHTKLILNIISENERTGLISNILSNL